MSNRQEDAPESGKMAESAAMEVDPDAEEVPAMDLLRAMTASGERDRLMRILNSKLIECGWVAQTQATIQRAIHDIGPDNLNFDSLSARVPLSSMRANVPPELRTQMAQRINNWLVNYLQAEAQAKEETQKPVEPMAEVQTAQNGVAEVERDDTGDGEEAMGHEDVGNEEVRQEEHSEVDCSQSRVALQ